MTRTETPAAAAPVAAARPTPGPAVPWPLGLVLAAVAGAGMNLAFPPFGWWPCAPLAVAVLAVALHRRRPRAGFLLGCVYGLAFFPVLLYWVRVIGYDAMVALSVIESVYLGLMGIGAALLSRFRTWPLWIAFLWVSQEFLRSRVPFGGFSWGRLAFAETDSPYTALASLGGAPLLTFTVALTGTLLAWAAIGVLTRRPRALPRGAAAGVLAVLLACAGLLVPAATYSGRSVTVAAIQGNVPRIGLDFLGQREAVLKNHVNTTHQLAREIRAGKRPRPAFVVWPENSSDVDALHDPEAAALISGAANDVGVPILVGTLVVTPDNKHLRNTGVVWHPGSGPGSGPSQQYVKRHLVPFGEYIPLRSLLEKHIARLKMIPLDFQPGTTPGRMRIAGYRVGDVMCFEVAYDDIVRESAAGGQLITVQTNNATYAHTLELEQQFDMSRLRAIEHGMPVVIASTSGISGIIDAHGEVRAKSGQFVRQIYDQPLRLTTGPTLADRLGPWPERTGAVVGFAAVLLAAAAAVRARRRSRLAGEE